MTNSVKRFASLLLVLVMVFSMLPGGLVHAQAMEMPRELAQEAYEEADLIFDQLDAAEEGPDKKNTTKEQQVEAAIEIVLASDSYVEDSLERNGNSFTWWTDGGVRCVYSPRMREIEEERTPATSCDEIVNEPVALKGGSPVGNQVYLIGPYYGSDSSFTDQYKKEAKRVAEAIGDADGYTLYSGVSATVDKVAEAVSNGAVVFFDSHGMTDYENPGNEYDFITGATYSYLCLTSTTGLTSEDYNDGALYYSDGICINGATIANHMTKNSPGGFLWMAICLGMATDTICQPLREMGVEVVYGYSESVTFEGDYRFERTFWDSFLQGETVAESISKMKNKWGNYDWSTQIANDYGSYDGYTSVSEAQRDFIAFPVVVSDEDTFPGKRTSSSYGASSLQTVKSTYTLFSPCDHVWTEATCTAASVCTLCGRTNGKPAPHTDNNGDNLCDICGADLSVTPNTYVKVTETPDDWSGQYLIVWESGGLALNGALTSLDSVSNGFSVTIENDTIVLDDANADRYFVIEPYQSWYTVRSAGGYYIGNSSGGNKLQYSKNPDYVNDLFMDADGSVLIEADDYSILRFNKTSGQMRFRYYKKASYGSQEPVALYKLMESNTPAGCSHVYDGGVVTTLPTCTEDGVLTFTCTLCGVTETASTSAFGHNYINGTCANCGELESGSSSAPFATAGVVIGNYASAQGWTNGQKYTTISLDENITAFAYGGANTGRFYTSGQNWRFYQSESAELFLSGNSDAVVITSVKISYLSYNGGVLILGDAHIAPDEVIAVNGNSVDLYVGNMGSANNGQARITAIEVTYQLAAHSHTAAAAVIENEKTVTCTVNGSYDSVVYCAECGEEISRTNITITAPGHKDETQDHICDFCGEVLSQCADHNSDGKCDLCGADLGPAVDENAKFASTGLSLGAFIGLQSAIMKSALNGRDFDEAYFLYKNAAGETIRGELLDQGSYFVADVPVNAKQMADVYEITPVYVNDGVTYYGVTKTASVMEEAMKKVNDAATADATKALCIAMLNYGAEAQKNFGYNTENLANAELTDAQKVLPAFADLNLTKTNSIPTAPIKPAKAGMSLGDVVYMQFLVKKADVNANSLLHYYIGDVPTGEIAISELETLSSYYIVNIPIKAKNVRTDITISIQTATMEYYEMVCSIEAFATEKAGTDTESLVAALMAYGDAADVLF